MRTLIRWVGVTVVTSASIGGAAAMMYLPASSSAATKPTPAPAPAQDVVTPQITALVNQAQQLNSEIGAAQSELAHLKDQVTQVAGTHYYIPVPTPVIQVQTSSRQRSTTTTTTTTTLPRVTPKKVLTIATKRPLTHTSTGASGASSSKGDDSNESSSSNGYGDN